MSHSSTASVQQNISNIPPIIRWESTSIMDTIMSPVSFVTALLIKIYCGRSTQSVVNILQNKDNAITPEKSEVQL